MSTETTPKDLEAELLDGISDLGADAENPSQSADGGTHNTQVLRAERAAANRSKLSELLSEAEKLNLDGGGEDTNDLLAGIDALGEPEPDTATVATESGESFNEDDLLAGIDSLGELDAGTASIETGESFSEDDLLAGIDLLGEPDGGTVAIESGESFNEDDLLAGIDALGRGDTETVESALATTTPEEVAEEVNRLNASLSVVPKQTMVLTTAHAVARVAVIMVVRRKAKELTAEAIATALGTSTIASPAAAALISAGMDAYRIKTGGMAKMYESAAQHTKSAVFSWKNETITGSESQRENEKNRSEGKWSFPRKLLRKVGSAMNAFRSATTQVAMGITVARSKVSEELSNFNVDAQLTDEQLKEKVLAAFTNKKIDANDVLNLGKTLARLRVMGNYGDIDVYGAEGSGWNKVNKAHTPEMMAQLHRVLNELVQSGQIKPSISWNQEGFKKDWDEEYNDVDRKGKDKLRKTFAVTGSAVATFVTAGLVTKLVDKIAHFDAEKFKAEHTQEVDQQVQNEDLDNVASSDAEHSGIHHSVETDKFPKVPDDHDSTDVMAPVTGAESVDTSTTETDTEVPHVDTDVPSSTEVPHVETPHTNVPSTTEVTPTEVPPVEHSPETVTHVGVPSSTTTAETPTVLSESAAELRDLGNDKLPWDAIMSSIRHNNALEVTNINGTTNVIKNLYRALNANVDMGTIRADSSFAIPHELGGTLPDGAVGWFFSEDQIENLAPQIDEAINAFNAGKELTDIQEVLIHLNSTEGVVSSTIDELNRNPQLFQEIMDIANG